MKEDIENWIDIEQDASILLPEVEEKITKKQRNDLNYEDNEKNLDNFLNLNFFELQQVKKQKV